MTLEGREPLCPGVEDSADLHRTMGRLGSVRQRHMVDELGLAVVEGGHRVVVPRVERGVHQTDDLDRLL